MPGTAISAAERPLRLLLAAVVLLPALVFVAAALLSYQQHFADARVRLGRDIDILYEQSAKVFETLDLVAARVDELLAGRTDDEVRAREGEFHDRAKAFTAPMEQVQFVLVIDREGHPLLFSALYPTVRATDYSTRDYFLALLENTVPGGQSFVSAVLRGRLQTDNTTFLIAMRRGTSLMAAGEREFQGVVAISTKPAYFVEHFRQIAGRDLDTVTLLRADGAVLARFPGAVDIAARLPPGSAFLNAMAQNPDQGAYETVSAVDGVARLYAYRRLPRHPVYVTAGIDRARVLAGWRAMLVRNGLFAVPVTGALAVLALTALRRARGEALAVARLAERTRELDRVWRTSRDLFAVGDRHGSLLAANTAWAEALGLSPDEVVGRPFAGFVHPDDLPTVDQAAERMAAGEVVRDMDVRLRTHDGSVRWFSWTWVAEGDRVHAFGRDITERRQLAEQLRQAQKMEAVGQLTGGIAHDFNNMLAVVVGSLELLGRRLDAGDARARRFVDSAMDGARRAALLTQRLLAFSRQQPLRPERVDVDALVESMTELIRGSLGGDIRLETRSVDGGCFVHVDQNQLENVLLNLALNARDAMPDGGRLAIDTSRAELDARYAAAHVGITAGQYVLVAVTDDGVGMSEDVAAKAFDPFFTTKEIGKGTGLGLSQAYGFARQSGGHVKIYSEPGLGTTVNLYLPRLTEAADGRAAEPSAPAMRRGTSREVVLVVEDDPGVRQFSVEAVRELGYGVLEADGAAAALRLIESHPDIALLFTDVVMPDVNGAKLAREACQRRPDLKVLFTTGYSGKGVTANGLLEPGSKLIGKPFGIADLGVKMREVLDTPVA